MEFLHFSLSSYYVPSLSVWKNPLSVFFPWCEGPSVCAFAIWKYIVLPYTFQMSVLPLALSLFSCCGFVSAPDVFNSFYRRPQMYGSFFRRPAGNQVSAPDLIFQIYLMWQRIKIVNFRRLFCSRRYSAQRLSAFHFPHASLLFPCNNDGPDELVLMKCGIASP
jgi:hypothetical protein